MNRFVDKPRYGVSITAAAACKFTNNVVGNRVICCIDDCGRIAKRFKYDDEANYVGLCHLHWMIEEATKK